MIIRKGKATLFTEEEESFIVESYRDGMSAKLIAKKMGIGDTAIYRILKKHSVKMRTDREQALKYKFNEDYFNVIDTEEKAYWLGFISADGYIKAKRKHSSRQLGIAISYLDEDHLVKFKKAIDSNHKISRYSPKTKYNSKDYVRILLASDKVCDDVERLGVLENKSLKLIFPTEDKVPKHLLRHYMRGYFDGDGGISIRENGGTSLSLCGTKEFLTAFLGELGLDKKLYQRHPEREVNSWQVSICGKHRILSVLDFLYEDSTIHLTRKYEKYLLFKTNIYK